LTALGARPPHLYVHVPFCERKCPYCDFNSHAGRDAEQARYVDALLEEARRHAAGLAPVTIFVGGGTPTHLSEDLLERLLGGLLEVVSTERLLEATVEANPGTLTAAKVRALRRAGITRGSVGVQSFDDRHLRTLGRIHDGAAAERAVRALQDGGVERVSLDLILAVPGQTLAEQESDLDRAVALGTEHVSAYVLTIEEGTAFHSWVRHGLLLPPDEDRDLAHLRLAVERLSAAGLRRYEISNHARPGRESLHNLAYWRNREWLGLGAGAHSHVAGERWKNEDDPRRYADRVLAGADAVVFRERPDLPTVLFETLMMGLRLLDGVDLDEVHARSGLDARVVFADEIARHVADGLVVVDGGRMALTERGLELSSYVTRSFLPAADEPRSAGGRPVTPERTSTR
jgi:oxygen-independent coproporphyrinogen-3 oxidase